MLLAPRGRIDMARRDAQGSSALDPAVASGSATVLQRVSGAPALRLDKVCLPAKGGVLNTVLNSPDAYWVALRSQGFASDARACPGLRARVVKALAADPSRVLVGWLGENLQKRLPQLGPGGKGATWTAALGKTLAGTYILKASTKSVRASSCAPMAALATN